MRKRIGFHITVSHDNTIVDPLVKESIRKTIVQYLNKGIKIVNWKIRIGQHADDFVQNCYTVACTGEIVAVPRIISTYLLKNIYEIRHIKHR